MNKRTLHGPHGVVLVLDPMDDATPAMVYARALGHTYSSTYDCATATGEVDDAVTLTAEQVEWLEHQSDAVDVAYTLARPEFAPIFADEDHTPPVGLAAFAAHVWMDA
jgi:hypothetical protein